MTHSFDRRVFAVKNESGVAWPPFAIAKLGPVLTRDGIEGERPTHSIDKPDGEPGGIYVVNGSITIAAGQISVGVFWKEADYVLVNADETVELNDEVGPVADSWAVSMDGDGLIVQDEKDGQNVAPVVNAARNDRQEAVLITDLDGVEDPRGQPSSAEFAFLVERADGTLRYGRKANDVIRTATVWHRLTFAIPAGTYIQVEKLSGRWRPYVANCESTGSSISESFGEGS